MKKKCFLIALLLCSVIIPKASAEVKEEGVYNPVNLALELKNAHIWRGIDVTHNLLVDANLRLIDKSKTFAFGLWGATTFTKDFREFDYYVGFYKGGFSAEIWDVFNFSDANAYNPVTNSGYNVHDAFDYCARTTGHFVDLRLNYRISNDFPLNISWNTVIFGRDRARLSILDAATGTYSQKYSSSRYSNYVELSYPVWKSDLVDVNVGVGGVFAFKEAKIDGEKIKGNFYGNTSGIVNATLAVSKRLKISDSYTLPVTATAVWNPQAQKTYMEIALQVVQF